MKRLIFLLAVLPLLTAGCITLKPVTNAPQIGTPAASATLAPTPYSTDTPASNRNAAATCRDCQRFAH